MGNNQSGKGRRPGMAPKNTSINFKAIADRFQTIDQVTAELQRSGLESSNLILGVDFTSSNKWTGKRTFGGRSLHDVLPGAMNPYEQAIATIGQTLEPFDDDKLIPAYGFGDATTGDMGVFGFLPNEEPCHTFQNVLSCYREIVPNVNLAGPTSFGPIINKAVDIVKRTMKYHILVIVADGQVTRSSDLRYGQFSPQEQDTVDAIVRASNFPLSIVLVGVGDGPWDMMRQFDDSLPQRTFDNFQFVEFHRVVTTFPHNPLPAFALRALMEVPDQYKAIQRLRLGTRMNNVYVPNIKVLPPPPKKAVVPAAVPGGVPAYAMPGQVVGGVPGYPVPPVGVPVAPPIPPAAQTAGTQQWQCQGCTSFNVIGAPQCAVCGTAAPRVSAHSISPSFHTSPASAHSLSPASAPPAPMADEKLCTVCMERPKNTAFNCGHQLCEVCAPQMSFCPICRQAVTARIRLY